MILEVYGADTSLEHLVDTIRNAIASRKLVIILGECSVDYIGRSESRLSTGERLIIIKQDGAFLVHRPTGHSPVNWQPETSAIEVKKSDKGIEITAIRRSPREIVRVYLNKIELVVISKLVDSGEFMMYLDEGELRDLLMYKPELIEDGLKIIEKEKKLPVGSIDLFGFDKNGRPVIIEVKRITASKEAVYQLYKYVESYYKNYGVKPRGILVAPGFTKSAIEALERLSLEYKQYSLQKLWNLKKELMNHRFKGRSILDYL